MDVLKSEVDANFDYFERNLSQFLPDHLGQYALLHQRTLVDFFDKVGRLPCWVVALP